MNKLFSDKILDIYFYDGILLFNSNEINKAHITWETIWKNGKTKDRKIIKGFIQLSGAIINETRDKEIAAQYLYKKSISNLKLIVSHVIINKEIKILINAIQHRSNKKDDSIKISISKQTFLT